MQSEFAAAIGALEEMKRERDEARKALDEEKGEKEAFNRENVSLRLRVRELETELQEREAGY
jgi:predicted  nucleic acid-binding Zn-ribbon protein